MNIANENFFLSAYEPETSGTFMFFSGRLVLTVDVKHSVFDYKGRKAESFHINTKKYRHYTWWIPHGVGCIGWKVYIHWRK